MLSRPMMQTASPGFTTTARDMGEPPSPAWSTPGRFVSREVSCVQPGTLGVATFEVENVTLPARPALKVCAYDTVVPGSPVCALSGAKLLVAAFTTIVLSEAVLLAASEAGSPPPLAVAKLVTEGTATDATVTTSVIGGALVPEVSAAARVH